MSKIDEIRKRSGANIRMSVGADKTPRLLDGVKPAPAPVGADRLDGVSRSKDAAEIPIDRIERDPNQPREDFDPEAMDRLAHSLRTRGQLQPIRVRWADSVGRYMIVAGERRWRAARMAGMATISCIVDEEARTAEELLAIQLIENCVREDLSPMEQAKAYSSVMQSKQWSTRQLGAELGISSTTVSRAVALLDLPESVKRHIEQGELAPASAYEISRVDDPEAQGHIAEVAIANKLNRNEVEKLSMAVKAKLPAPRRTPPPETIELGEGITVTVKYRRSSEVTVIQALRRAIRSIQDRTKEEDAA